MKFEQWLEAKGFTAADLSEGQLTSLKAMWEAEQAAPAGDGQPSKGTPAPVADKTVQADADKDLVASREKVVVETRRVDKIKALHAEFGGDMEAATAATMRDEAIRAGWDENKAEVTFIRAARPKAPQGPVTKGSMTGPKVLEAAICMGQSLQSEADMLAEFGADTLEEAHGYRKMGLQQLCAMSARMAGHDLPIEIGSMEYMHAAFSTTSLSGIVGNVANKALQKAFKAMNPVAPKISAKVNHSNFHLHTVYSMIFNGDLELVGPDGEIQHLKVNEESYTRQVSTRAAMLRITRQDIINDNLGAFTRTANAMSRKAVVAREKALFTIINATAVGASFFTSANANYFAGAATNLQLSSLGTAVQMFRDQTGPDGDPVMIEPKILLVPTALEETAKALMDRDARLLAVALGSTSSAAKGPDANVWAGQFSIEQSPYLSNSGLTGYSSTAWYLLADPADMPAFEISYLNGNETPVVEYFGLDSEADTLGVTYRVYWDFGVGTAEKRAGVKSKGAA